MSADTIQWNKTENCGVFFNRTQISQGGNRLTQIRYFITFGYLIYRPLSLTWKILQRLNCTTEVRHRLNANPYMLTSSSHMVDEIPWNLAVLQVFRHTWRAPAMSFREVVHSLMMYQWLYICCVACVRNQMTVPHHWCGTVIWFLTLAVIKKQEMFSPSRKWDTTKIHMGSSPSVVYGNFSMGRQK